MKNKTSKRAKRDLAWSEAPEVDFGAYRITQILLSYLNATAELKTQHDRRRRQHDVALTVGGLDDLEPFHLAFQAHLRSKASHQPTT